MGHTHIDPMVYNGKEYCRYCPFILEMLGLPKEIDRYFPNKDGTITFITDSSVHEFKNGEWTIKESLHKKQ